MLAETLAAGYGRASREFHGWGSILNGAPTQASWPARLRHVACAGGWKKLEPMWGWVIRMKPVTSMLPILQSVLEGLGRHAPLKDAVGPGDPPAPP
jgi:hypothetical protein